MKRSEAVELLRETADAIESGEIQRGWLGQVMGHVLLIEEPDLEEPPDFVVDPARLQAEATTGIVVRSRLGDSWAPHDIATLTRASLLVWLRSKPHLAEAVCVILLGHPAADRG